jgi:hypothetical protein
MHNNIDSENVKIGEIDGRNIYRTTTNNFKTELFNKIVVTRKELIDKYPEYEQINKNKLFDIASIKSKKIADLIPIENTPIRLRQGFELPNITGYSFQWYNFIVDGFQACRNYSIANGVESGGYIFPDGRALFIIDSCATSSSMNIPVWANGSSASFHYHPDSTTNMSSTDSIAFNVMRQYAIDSMIIITADTIVGYGF